MLDDDGTPGQTLCVFCRMEARPTIWYVVDNILNSDAYNEDIENDPLDEGNVYDENSIVVVEEQDDRADKNS